ncbi:aspartate aminotransferase family protein [Rhizobium sp. P32RR-XVIII]|uniref:aspartate aminotransferase family protein n=1 Tax=Rhizobium sp. P32RR-XVIII TaxID=2726738 RepID=UPI00145768F3|nr:aspartate aminotransferase family protein [Rhizobium sp. P32RR-XVIII]NLS07158.1 aspartate aminotransferase family protein [Rhizobium sp. P32RR-XVIII]
MLHTRDISGGRPLSRARSQYFFNRSRKIFPSGVTRVTVERRPVPLYVARGEGAYLLDVDGNRYLDLNNNFTTLIHGHGFLPVAEAVADLLHRGTCFSNPTEHEISLAELLVDRIPAIEQVRFVNSGTEAVMFAIKAARAFTGRSGIIRVEGAYHGAYDWAEAGQASAPSVWGDENRPAAVAVYRGTPSSVAEDVAVIRFNDSAGLERRMDEIAATTACILIDPMPSRAGLIGPDPDFLKALQASARRHGILVVADEVLNLRQSYHGASDRYRLEPDLIACGKIIGGGFPVGAIGGRSGVMSVFANDKGKPLLPQGGTFSANPVSMVAGRVAMEAMTEEAFDALEKLGDQVRSGLQVAIVRSGASFSVTGAASLFRIHPKKAPPCDFRSGYPTPAESSIGNALCDHFLQRGIMLPNGAAASLSTAMTPYEAEAIVATFADFLSTPAVQEFEASR